MSWNYRVVRRLIDKMFTTYGIHEVYYHDDGRPRSMTADPVEVVGDTPDEVRWEVDRLARALTEPILDESEFTQSGDFENDP